MWKVVRRAGSLCMVSTLLLFCMLIGQSQSAFARIHTYNALMHHTLRSSHTYWTLARMIHARALDATGKATPVYQTVGQHPAKSDAVEVPPDSYNTLPYAAEGRVFFTDPQTQIDYACSGTAVTSTNKSVVDTAGHCVMQGGSGSNYYTNWMFCPQRLEGNCPLGQWNAEQLFTSTQWATSGSASRDFGFAVVGQNQQGQALDDVVKPVSLVTNLSDTETFTALGYPAQAPFDGEHMYSCDSPTTTVDIRQGKPRPIGIACNMNEGSSGGGWLVQLNGTWFLNGNTSYSYASVPDTLFSPYYDSYVKTIFNQAENS